MENYREYININPDIRFGKPCIKNIRITVGDILDWVSLGMTFDDIYQDFPEIKKTHPRNAQFRRTQGNSNLNNLLYHEHTS